MVSEDELRTLRDTDEQVAHLISTAIKLEGLYRHASTHAAGLVIADRYLPELVPIYRDPRSDMPVTQFNMKAVEQVGLVKFDFLGLKTLTVIDKAVSLLEMRGINVDINSIPLDDSKTFQMLTNGDTVGVFQLESNGMRDVLRGMKPDRFEDIIAVVALYRPGPMENIPTYISRKHGREEVTYMHALLEPILSETYGIMIYQEQVQQAARDLAGYTLGVRICCGVPWEKKSKRRWISSVIFLSKVLAKIILAQSWHQIFLIRLPRLPAMDLTNHMLLLMRWCVIRQPG